MGFGIIIKKHKNWKNLFIEDLSPKLLVNVAFLETGIFSTISYSEGVKHEVERLCEYIVIHLWYKHPYKPDATLCRLLGVDMWTLHERFFHVPERWPRDGRALLMWHWPRSWRAWRGRWWLCLGSWELWSWRSPAGLRTPPKPQLTWTGCWSLQRRHGQRTPPSEIPEPPDHPSGHIPLYLVQ